MKIDITNNLREDSKVTFFAVRCEDYKHVIVMYLDNLTNEDVFLYIDEYKYIYNGRTHIYINSSATALTNAISPDFDKAYNISQYSELISYFKSKYNNDEHAYNKIINDMKSKGISVDVEVEDKEEDNYEYIKRKFM